MAYPLMFSISLCFLLFFHGCFAQLEQQQKQTWQNFQQLQQHRLRAKTQCSINRLNAQEPTIRLESEAGVTEFWDPNSEEFECAGVQAVRHVINRQGLLLPYYTNTPKLVYILQGSGILGTVIPGCAETYETELHSLQEEGSRGEERGQGFGDRHQKLRRFRQGDVLALPAGITHWTYNDGQEPIISVAIIDNANEANQLDLNYRRFFLAGKPPTSQQSYGERERGTEGGRGQREREEEGSQQRSNIFNGFDEEILSEIFNVDAETIRNIQGQNDQRGSIVRAERLRLVVPEYEEEERQRERGRGRPANGLEETLCTMRLRENIRHPARSDIYNPRGGRISTINSQTLPVLNMLQLSAEHGVLYRNAMMAPHWVMNAHCVVYVTKGSARIQVVGNRGRSVFDDEVREGQILVVPQNFVVVKKASEQGFEYINFRTNDNFVTSLLAGRLSVIRSMPEEVLMNSYQISRDEVRNLKFNREEAHVFSPGSRSSRGQD